MFSALSRGFYKKDNIIIVITVTRYERTDHCDKLLKGRYQYKCLK